MIEYNTHLLDSREIANADIAQAELFGWVCVGMSQIDGEYLVKYARDLDMPFGQQLKELETRLQEASERKKATKSQRLSRAPVKLFAILSIVSLIIGILWVIGYFIADFWGGKTIVSVSIAIFSVSFVLAFVFVCFFAYYRQKYLTTSASSRVSELRFKQVSEEVELKRSAIMNMEEVRSYLSNFKNRMRG